MYTNKKQGQALAHHTTQKPSAFLDKTFSRNLPNSILLSVLNQNSSDIPVLFPHPQAQIPAAETEAERLSSTVSSGTPETVKEIMGQKLGTDFSDVRFHTDSAAAQKAAAIGAKAFTSGADIYFDTKGFEASTAAHELVHTVQQGIVNSDSVSVSTPLGGIQMNPNIGSLPECWEDGKEITNNSYKELRDFTQRAYDAKTDEERDKLHRKILEYGRKYLELELSKRVPRIRNTTYNNERDYVKTYLLKLGPIENGADGFHFGDDVIYGIEKDRRAFMLKQLGNNLPEFWRGMYQNHITDIVWDVNNPEYSFEDAEIAKRVLETAPQLEKHNPEFAKKLIKRTQGFNAFLKKKGEQNSKYNVWKKSDDESNDKFADKTTEIWKRTSKAGLEYQLKERDKPVYFAVDSLDLKDVIKGKDSGEFSSSITSSEIRWLYRHREEEDVKKNLKLYKSDGKIVPLEDFFGDSDNSVGNGNKDIWQKYEEYRKRDKRTGEPPAPQNT